jgi:selenide, water dikinase
VLGLLPKVTDRNVLVGTETADDAAVYRLRRDLAVVATLDFFTPIVDDPYDFGAIAAANSLSDVYAMGARPVLALSILGFPTTKLPLSVMGAIVKGGAEKAAEAGCPLIGGHSIDDAEPKFGLSVVGVVHPSRILRNRGAKPGDVLFLTKPLGSGILTTALKRGKLPKDLLDFVVAVMKQLNASASEAAQEVGVHAATDVTGFGLLGHLRGMLLASGAAARLRLGAVPLIHGVLDFAREDVVPGGTKKNLANFGRTTRFDGAWSDAEKLAVADAQTSGGLLLAVPKKKADALAGALDKRGLEHASRIGEVEKGEPGSIVFVR